MSQAVGFHAASAVLTDAPDRARVLYVQRGRRDGRMQALLELAGAAGVRVEWVERRLLDQRADGHHQGVLLECHAVALHSEAELELAWPDFPSAPLILVLEGVTDPRNLGACLRSASAAGVHAVLLPKRRSAPVNALAEQTSAGGAAQLFLVEVTNLARRLSWLKEQGVWILGAAGEGDTRWDQADLRGPTALVLGSEGAGLRALTRKLCDALISIPLTGPVASLNVSVAAGILLFEAVRQRVA